MDLTKEACVEELPCVLWSYRTTVHIDIKETPFRLTFEQDVVILIEIGQTLDHACSYSKEDID